jgi:uncharacterized protein
MLELRPNCECCNKDLPPEAADAVMCSFECTFCRGLRGDDAGWALPELWRRIGGSSHTPGREAGALSCIHRARGQIGRLCRSFSLAGSAIAVGVVGGHHD